MRISLAGCRLAVLLLTLTAASAVSADSQRYTVTGSLKMVAGATGNVEPPKQRGFYVIRDGRKQMSAWVSIILGL